ncbi:LamG-like jellyroll fold domain-containing protein [Streptomyces sp. TRM 70361]|uniref:LamG-like jellyroll fold domain-containing protein n=1 Tax=Streptomyces sp. TRM 70361 TaxID=3116553 RepID=UPI002E7AB3C4|nr:LamG-like jellyroll fold domain-containing protein [Streptomyces sp. TRM 70361]MEE1941934.1 LamG-like jellyroll fold domain-containing protein [Streptomyces sp. TRM 70361]
MVLGAALAVGLLPGVDWERAVARPAEAVRGEGAEARASAESKALMEAKRSGEPVEITSLRGETSEVHATPDGDLEAVEYLRPVRARVAGEWKPVDTGLARTGEGTVAPGATTVALEFSGGGDGPLVRMTKAGRELSLTWPQELPTPELDGDTAVYREVLPGVDLRMGAQADGFTQLLVVKTSEAANSAALNELRLRLGTGGVRVRETADGGLEAVDDGAGGAVFEAPTPLMWDSSGGAETGEAAVRSSALSGTGGGEPGAGESGKLAPVGVEVPVGGGELVLSPDKGVLRGEDTVYPVFIDPQWYSPRASAWTMASQYWASSPQWKFNGDPDAGLGYCGWDYCRPHDTKRLFYRIPTKRFEGRTVLSAEFVVRNVWSASCSAREVQLWRTRGISSSTTWNTQNADGFWVDRLRTASFAHGYEGCAAKDAEFDVKPAVQQAADGRWDTLTFGLRASSETDRYGWKRFSDKAHLRVRYNRPPPQIRMSQLVQDPGGTCARPGAAKRVRTLPKVRANNVTDPDGDNVAVQFQLSWDTGDGKGFTGRWTSSRTTYKASGSDFVITLPGSTPKNRTVGWHVRSHDGAQWSPWSWVGSATSCNMVYDTTVPAGPSIGSGQYPASDPEDPDDPWHDGVGRYGGFTVDSPTSDVVRYRFGINGDPTAANTLTTSGGGAETVDFMPTRPGLNFVTAQAFDAAGNGSEIRTYQFRVRAGQPERLAWSLDEPAGVGAVGGAGGTWQATLSGARSGAEGRTGGALSFDGTDDHAATVSPVLHTGKSFSVSLWARLPAAGPDREVVALSQEGRGGSGFELSYSPDSGGWVFSRHRSDSAGAAVARAAQPACPQGDTACTAGRLETWTHVAGVFDNPAGRLRLYVDGRQVADAPFTGPWDARGRTLLGAALRSGSTGGFFAGDLDDVQLFDYQLTDPQVALLGEGKPVHTSRPAKLVWPLDEEPEATAVTGRAQQVEATLRGGARTGVPGTSGTALRLDGTDDHADTDRPVLDTHQSFSVSLWARLPEDKADRPMVAVTQASSQAQGFELSHSSALGGWVFLRPRSDASGTGITRAAQQACPAGTNCPAARLGEWTHVTGVYDHDARQLRLYVDGSLVATEPFTTPWLATGPVTLGAALHADGPGGFLEGDLDDVRLYDRAVSGDEVRQLVKQRPLVKGRWMFEETAGTAPVTTPDDSAEGNPMTLHGGARTGTGWIDLGGLELDGVDDHAATGTVPVDTGASFTVTAWARAAAVPGNGPVTVLSAEGGRNSAFAVRYLPGADGSPASGHWRITMPGEDDEAAPATEVDHHLYGDVTSWQHLALVYDGFAKRLSLYVNGELEETACADAEGDGSADDAQCTERASWAENALSFTAGRTLQVGRVKTAGSWGEYWPGTVDDVWVVQGALSDAQVEYLAGQWFEVPTGIPGPD